MNLMIMGVTKCECFTQLQIINVMFNTQCAGTGRYAFKVYIAGVDFGDNQSSRHF